MWIMANTPLIVAKILLFVGFSKKKESFLHLYSHFPSICLEDTVDFPNFADG